MIRHDASVRARFAFRVGGRGGGHEGGVSYNHGAVVTGVIYIGFTIS